MALFKRDFDAFRVNWQNADGAKNKVNSVFSTLTPSANLDQPNSITNVSKDQIQMLRTWNRAVASNCTQQETFNRIIANADDQTKMYFNSLNKGKASIQGLSAAQEVAEQSTIGLTLASTALNAAISIGIGLLIQLAVNGLSKFIHYADDAAEASETAASNISSFNNSVREQNSTISKLAPEYAELSSHVNAFGDVTGLTTDELNRYHEITNQIADMFPTLVQGYDSTGNAILRTKGNLEELNEAYKEAQRQQAWDVISENEEDIVKNANLTLNKNYGLRGTNVVYPNDALDKLLKNATSQDQFGQAASELYQEAMDKQWGFQYNALNEHIKEETGHYLSEFGTLNQEEYNAAIEAMRSYFSKVNAEYESEVAKLQDLAQSYLTLNKDFHNELDATTQNYASQLVGAIDGDTWTKIQESGGNIGDYVNNIVSSLKNDSTFRDAMTDIFSLKDADLPVDEAWQKLNDAIKILADRLQLDENTLKIQLGFEDMDSLKAKYDEALSKAQDKFKDEDVSQFFRENIKDEDDIARWNKVAEAANTAVEAVEKYMRVLANETPYSFLEQTDATDLAERMKYIQKQFENGQITYEDYFSSLQSELDGVNWRTFTDNAEEANEMAQQFFMDTIKTVSKELPDMLSKFENKEIDVTEYINGFLSLAETINSLTDNVQENSKSWNENGEALDENVSDSLDNTQESLSGAIEQVSSLAGSVEALNMIQSHTVEEGSDEYDMYVEKIGADLAAIQEHGGLMADEIAERLGTSSAAITQSLQEDTSNFAVGMQAITANVNDGIAKMAMSIGNIFKSLGEIIKNFKVTFSLKKVGEGTVQDLIKGLFGQGESKPISFEFSANGDDNAETLGNAVADLGSMVEGAINSFQISPDDYSFNSDSKGDKKAAKSASKANKQSDKDSKKADEAEKKRADAQKEYAKKVKEIDKKLEELDKKEHLQELKDTIEESTLAVERFDDKLDLLDLKLDIFDEDDYSSRADVMAQKLDLVTQKGQSLKDEFQRLSVTQPQTADEANEIASRMEKIGDSLRSNLKDWVSYSKELEEIRVDAIVQDAFKKIDFEMPDISSMRDNFEQEISAIEHNIKALKGDTLFGDVQLFQNIMPLAPKKSEAEKQADETKALHEEQLTELEEYEAQVYEIRQNALEMQKAANAEAIEEERQELYESLEEAKAKLEETLGSVSESLANAATSASSSFSGISSSVDQATSSINKYNEAVNNMNPPKFSPDVWARNSGYQEAAATKSISPDVWARNSGYKEASAIKRATGGTVGYNETTLGGEQGPEAAILPDGKFVMIGENGAQLVDLPIGTKVIPADETADILSYTGRGIIGTTIPRLAEGNVGDVTVNVAGQESAATDEQIYYNLKLQEIEYLRQLSELLKYVNSLRTTTELTPSNRETAIGTEPTASSMTTGDSQVRDFIDTTSSAINSGLNSKNISLDGIKQQVIKSLSDKGFITEAEKTAQDSATEITDKVGKEIENTEDINLLEAMMGGEQDTTKITQDILKNFKDLPAEIQKQLGDKGVSSEDWDKMIADPSNQLEALQLLQDGSDTSWDNLPETMQTLLQTYGVTGKEQWDAFVAENPLQSYQLLIESWDAEQASVMAYVNAMVDCVATGAAAIGATQIPAPQMSVESWNNLQNLIASKIQGILNTINATFNENAVDLNFNVNFEMGTATNNVQGSVSGAAAGSGNVPLYIQGDYQQPYGYKGTIATSGCGPTSMAMVLSAMTGQAIDPTVTAAWSASHGYRVDEGTSWAFFEAIGNEYGINTQNVSTSPDSLISTLASGKIMITSMGPGDFTRNGHFIVLTGVTSDGRIMVNDPNSVPKSQMTWDASRISSQCKQAWAFSYANGTKFHPGGKAIVGDEGFLKGLTRATPELIFHRNGTIDLAGINGPELRNLQRGDIVMNAHDTRRLLKGAGNDGTAIDGAPTYATGTQDAVNAIRNMFTKKASQKQSNSDSNEDIKSVTGGIEEAPQGTRIDVPDGLGKYTTYMAWSAVTATDSLQYKLRQDTGEQYNSEGFAVVNGRNVLAMTNTFGGIGDYVDVYLTNGNVIHGILGDAKHTGSPVWYDPNPANMWGHNDGQCIVEFVVQSGWNKGNPSLNGAGVDYVVNLGNYWGNPTFSGGANGGYLNAMNVKFNKWFNAVVEALKGELGTFSTNTHTAKRGIVDMFANGGITGDDLALIAEKKPELFYTKDGKLGLAKSPMLAKFPRGTEIISGDDTAEILKYLNPSRTKVKKFAEGTIDINSPSDRVIQAILAELFKDGFPDLDDSKNDLLKDIKESYEWAEGKLKDLSSEEAYKSFSSLKTDKWFDENGNFTEEYHEETEKFSKDLDDAAKETLSEFTDKVKWYNDEMLKAMNEAKDLLSDGGKNIVEFLEITGTSMTDFVKKMKEQAEMSDSESFAVYNDYLKSYNDRNLAINRLINDFLASPEELLAAKLKHQIEMAAGGEAIRSDNAFLSVLEQLGYSIEDIEGWYDETGAFTEKYLTDLDAARQSLSADMAELFQYYTESLSWYKKEWHISAGENGEFQKYIDQYGVYAQKLSMSDAIEAQNSAHQGVQDIINSEQFQDIAFKMGFAADEIESWFNRFGEVIPENFDAFIEKSREYLSEIENQDIKLPAPYDEEDIENLTTMVNNISELKKRWYLAADIPAEILNNSQLLADSKAHRDSVSELADNVRNDKDFQNILEELGYSLDDVEQWYTATGEFTEKFTKDTEGIAEKLSEDSRKLFETSVNLIADYKKEYSLADNLIPIYEDIQLLLEGVTDIKGQRQADIDYMASQADSILADEGFNKILGAIGASLEDVETWYDSTGEFTDAYVTKMADAQQLLGEAEYQALTGYTESLQYYRKKWLEANNLLYILNTTDDILNTRDVYEKNMAYQAQMEQGGRDIRNNPEFQAVLQKAGFDISYIDNWYDTFGEFTDQYYADVTKVTAALTDSEMQTFNTAIDGLQWYKREWYRVGGDIQALQEQIFNSDIFKQAREGLYDEIIRTARQNQRDNILGLYNVEKARILEEAETAKTVYSQAREAWNVAYDLYQQSLTDGSSYETQQKYYEKLQECNEALGDAQDWMNSIDDKWQDMIEGVVDYYNELAEIANMTNDIELSVNSRRIDEIDRDYSRQQRNRTQQIRLAEKHNATLNRNELLRERQASVQASADQVRADHADLYSYFEGLGLDLEKIWDAEGNKTRYYYDYKTLLDVAKDSQRAAELETLFEGVAANKANYVDIEDEIISNIVEAQEEEQELWQLGLDSAMQTADNIMNVHDNIISALQKEEEILNRQMNRTSKYTEQQSISRDMINNLGQQLQADVNKQAEANLLKNNLYNDPRYADVISWFDTSKWVDVNGERTAAYWNDVNDLQKIGNTEMYNDAEAFVQLLGQAQQFITDADMAVEDVRDNIKSTVDAYYQQQVDAANTAVETIISMLEQRKERELKALDQVHEKRMEQLQDEAELVQKLYNNAISLLDDVKSEEDYEKQLADEQKKADNLQAQIDQYALDDSDASAQKRIELQKQLNEQLETIDELKRNHEYEQTKKALNDDMDLYNDHFSELQEAEDEQYKYDQQLIEERYTQQAMYAEAYMTLQTGVFEDFTAKGVYSYETLYTKGNQVALDLTTAYDNFATETGAKFADMGIEFTNMIGLLNKSIELYDILQSKRVQAWNSDVNAPYADSSGIDFYHSDIRPTTNSFGNNSLVDSNGLTATEQLIVERMRQRSLAWADNDYGRNLHEENARDAALLGANHNVNYNDGEGRWYLDGKPLYHTGKISKESAKAFESIEKNLKPYEEIAKVRLDESIFTPEQMYSMARKITAMSTVNQAIPISALASLSKFDSQLGSAETTINNANNTDNSVHIGRLNIGAGNNVTKYAVRDVLSDLPEHWRKY